MHTSYEPCLCGDPACGRCFSQPRRGRGPHRCPGGCGRYAKDDLCAECEARISDDYVASETLRIEYPTGYEPSPARE